MCIWYRTQRGRGGMKETFLSDVAKNQHSDLYNLKHEKGSLFVYLTYYTVYFFMLQHLDQPSVFILTHYTRRLNRNAIKHIDE